MCRRCVSPTDLATDGTPCMVSEIFEQSARVTRAGQAQTEPPTASIDQIHMGVIGKHQVFQSSYTTGTVQPSQPQHMRPRDTHKTCESTSF